MPRPKPIVLTVLHGWVYPAESRGIAIALARKPPTPARFSARRRNPRFCSARALGG